MTGIFSTVPMTAYADGDESETDTDQDIKQKNVGSGDSVNFNCAQNLIKAGVSEQACGNWTKRKYCLPSNKPSLRPLFFYN